MDFKKGEYYVVVCERDIEINYKQKYPELTHVPEPIVFETALKSATKQAAMKRVQSLAGKYGKCYIAKLTFEKEN